MTLFLIVSKRNYPQWHSQWKWVHVHCSFVKGPSRGQRPIHVTPAQAEVLRQFLYIWAIKVSVLTPWAKSSHTSHSMVLKHKMEDEKAIFTGLKENSLSLLPHINTKEIFSSFSEHSVLNNIKSFCTGWARLENAWFWEFTNIFWEKKIIFSGERCYRWSSDLQKGHLKLRISISVQNHFASCTLSEKQ